MPGGTAYYLPLAMRSLGGNVAVVTKVGRGDQSLLDGLRREGIPVLVRESSQTATFINIYPPRLDSREQRVTSIAHPFTVEDVEGIQARVFHLGPLTRNDIPLDVLERLSKRSRVSLDVQGFLRDVQPGSIETGKVTLRDWQRKEEALPFVSILRANEDEARVLSGEADPRKMAFRLSEFGPEEIVITRGSKGSLIYSRGIFYDIPSFPPRRLVDPTGCGDTYMAGYLFLRQQSDNLQEVGEFAARTATAKLETSGPLARAT